MTRFSPDVLAIDLAATAEHLSAGFLAAVKKLGRRGAVVAVSGGIDSACVAALAVKAFGPQRLHFILLPERDSSPESTTLGEELCRTFGVAHTKHDIAPILEAAGCYRERDAAVRSVFPGFQGVMRWKMVLAGDRLATGKLPVWQVVVETEPPGGPSLDSGPLRGPTLGMSGPPAPAAAGKTETFRLTPEAYLRILAATNFKQRTRKMLEYFHADRLVYAVAGTPNLVEYDQGFFVKLGDGAADVKPIARLYKTQVYALARHLGVPSGITSREPTTDTYSLHQSQEEFYYSLDHKRMDLVLWAKDHGVPPEEAAPVLGLTPEHVRHAFEDVDRKRKVAEYLHAAPIVIEP